MANGVPDPGVQWLVVSCPACHAKSRVREAAAHRDFRCPHCQTIMSRPQPQPKANVAFQPAVSYKTRAADDSPTEPPAPLHAAHEVDDLEISRHRRPKPRRTALAEVFVFPWRPECLRAWVFFGIGFSFVALMGAWIYYIIWLHQSTDNESAQGVWSRVFILVMKGFVMFLLWTGAYASGFFFATIEDTAAGCERVASPDNGLRERVFTFLYLVWVFIFAAIPFGVLATPLKMALGTTAVYFWSLIPSVILIFPLALFCSLSNNYSLWMFWNNEVLARVFRKPLALLGTYVVSAIILTPCVLLGFLSIFVGEYYLIPVTGFVWSACFLMYGRLLGRLGFVIAEDDEEDGVVRRRRKRKRVVESVEESD